MQIKKFVVATALFSVLAVTSAAAEGSFRQLMYDWKQQQNRERENGYSGGGCDLGCQAFLGIVAMMVVERARRLRLQQEQRAR